MAVPMKPSSDQYGAYFPPGSEALYEQMGFTKRWENFTFAELCCKGTGALRVHYETMDKLQRLRYMYAGSIRINSYYRSAEYNAQVGGAEASLHLTGRAVDTPLLNGNLAGRMKLIHLATICGFRGFGLYETFTHMDTGRTRFWVGDNEEKFGTGSIMDWEYYPH